jgi:hypothetical protein
MNRAFPFEYVGNMHIHTDHSDGAASAQQIAAVARLVGLDFVALNDHSYLTDLHREEEGYYRGVLVLVGSEIGTRFHHYLAFNIEEQIGGEDLAPQEVIDAVNGQGGFGFVAHPFEKGMPFLEGGTAYTWNDWSVHGFTGISIWNFSSRWKENVKTLWHGIFHLIFKTYTLKAPSRKTLATWDNLCQQGRVVAVGGSDAHGSYVKLGPFKFRPLSYRFLLGTINTHILTFSPLSGNFVADREIVYHALKTGKCFVAHDGLFPAHGFRFFFTSDKGGERLEMGQEAPYSPGVATIAIPRSGLIRILRDGSLLKRHYGEEASLKIEKPGVYRVEVYKRTLLFGWRPWIFSNPIYLR